MTALERFIRLANPRCLEDYGLSVSFDELMREIKDREPGWEKVVSELGRGGIVLGIPTVHFCKRAEETE